MRFDNFRPKDMTQDNTVPEATYVLRCNKCTFKEPKDAERSGETETGVPTFTNKKGETVFPYLSFDFVIQDDGEQFGRHVFDNYVSLAPGDDWKLRQLMTAMEFDEDEALDTEAFVDREVTAVVTKTKAGKGKDGKWYDAQNRIGRYLSLSAQQ